jgi:hypothetical protein
MKVGDLVFEVPLGKLWYQNNPWIRNSKIGIITEIYPLQAMVLWPSGELKMLLRERLVGCNESR